MGDLSGSLFYRLSGRRRTIALDNIQKAKEAGALAADLDVEATARRSFMNMGRTALESFCLMHRGMDYFRDRCQHVGETEPIKGIIESARQAGCGVIFLTAHSGNWELSSAALPERYGVKISVVGRSQGWLLDEILKRVRGHGGGGFIAKDGGARTMLNILRVGGVLGTLFDQAAIVGPGSEKLTFMGRPAMTTMAPLRLSVKTGAPVLTFFCHRQGDRHIFEAAPAQFPPQGKDRQWLLETAQRLNDLLADFIRRHPDQWMWSHRRWKMPDYQGGTPLSQ
jgi:KDO2-lipid IV(A) lauroyltransferase